MADEKQLLWNHYQQLSEEIRAADTLNYQIIGVVVAAAVALVNAAFGKQDAERSWILLTIFAVTLPGRFLLEVARMRIWRVASYLEIFVEPELGFVKWQGRLIELRDFDVRQRKAGRHLHMGAEIIKTEFALMTLLDGIACLLIVVFNVGSIGWKALFSGYRPWPKPELSHMLFVAVAGLLMLHSLYRAGFANRRFDRCGEVHKGMRAGWRALKAAGSPLSESTPKIQETDDPGCAGCIDTPKRSLRELASGIWRKTGGGNAP